MKKVRYLMTMIIFGAVLILSGCGKINPNPYELSSEARKVMKPQEQQEYIALMQKMEELITSLNDESLSYDEEMKLMRDFYNNCPKDWTWNSNNTPIDLAWRFFMQNMDAFMGCRNYDNYADCKDQIDEWGKELSDYFKQYNDRRKALIIHEERFYQLYEAGKEAQQKNNEQGSQQSN